MAAVRYHPVTLVVTVTLVTMVTVGHFGVVAGYAARFSNREERYEAALPLWRDHS